MTTTKTNLTKAYHQWATRPADQRFWNLQEMLDAAKAHADRAIEKRVELSSLRAVAGANGEVQIVGKQGTPANMGYFAFGQLAGRVKAPAAYLRNLPPTLAAENLNYGIEQRKKEGKDNLYALFERGSSPGEPVHARALVTEKYSRIWNHELISKMRQNLDDGWRAPPARPASQDDPRARPATKEDLLDRRGGFLSVNEGDLIAPAGLYASDKDMFAFLVNESVTIDDGTPEGLARGIMLWNSEVGDKSLGGMAFLYKHVCGNHIVWDAKNVFKFSIRHVGRARYRAWTELRNQSRSYANAGAKAQEEAIRKARSFEIAASKEDVIEAVLSFARKRKVQGLTEARVSEAYQLAEKHEDWYGTTPNTAWGMVQGLTMVSQQREYADERQALDKAASKVIEMAG